MTKVRVAKITQKKFGSNRITAKQVRDSAGKPLSLFLVDSNDDNFDNDLTRVFSRNVARARKVNAFLFGSPDGPQKSPAKFKKAVRKQK